MDRWVNMAGETLTSHIPVATFFMDLFKTQGISLATTREGGFELIQPDLWSVKLSLLSLPEDFAARLRDVLNAYEKTVESRGTGYCKRLLKYATDVEKSTTGEGRLTSMCC